MSIGRAIARVRRRAGVSQRTLARRAGLGASHLSRLEHDQLTPRMSTLTRIAAALDLPATVFFADGGAHEPSQGCPVDLTGRCILDQPFHARGRRADGRTETYTPDQLAALRQCNFLLHQDRPEVRRALATMLDALLALAAEPAGR